ncbi:MAG: neutral/alkaline non-lysosomal ceramidase N-terminal domain-containing protein [Archangium sp.]
MKRRALVIAAVLLGLTAVVLGSASVDRCGEWPKKEPALSFVSRGQGEVKVGAARVDFTPPWPVPAGGYGPFPKSVSSALAPVSARALIIDVGAQRLALVVLDVLLVTPQLRDAIGKDQPFPTWVIATHTHSGPGAYAPSAAEELGALGSYDPAVEAALVANAREAVTQATAKLAFAKVEIGDTVTDGITVARSGTEADRRLIRVRFDGEKGAVAQLLILSAHPTTVERKPSGLHPDWPGLLAGKFEANGGPVTLVLQGAGGNASVNRAALPDAEAMALKLEALVKIMPTRTQPETLDAAWSEVHVSLPRPDAKNVVPSFAKPIVENAVCDDAEDLAVLHGLKLGDLNLLFVPVEPSYAAGRVLEQQAHVRRVVSLTDGYAGYVETDEAARAGTGEAKRQLFPPELLERLSEGARLAGATVQ